jgi:hypothetical protein
MAARKKTRPTILDSTDIAAVPNIEKVWRVAKQKLELTKPLKATVALTVPEGLVYLVGHLAKTHGMSRNKFLATLLNEDLYDAYLRVYNHLNLITHSRNRQRSSTPGDDDAIPFED